MQVVIEIQVEGVSEHIQCGTPVWVVGVVRRGAQGGKGNKMEMKGEDVQGVWCVVIYMQYRQ